MMEARPDPSSRNRLLTALAPADLALLSLSQGGSFKLETLLRKQAIPSNSLFFPMAG